MRREKKKKQRENSTNKGKCWPPLVMRAGFCSNGQPMMMIDQNEKGRKKEKREGERMKNQEKAKNRSNSSCDEINHKGCSLSSFCDQ